MYRFYEMLLHQVRTISLLSAATDLFGGFNIENLSRKYEFEALSLCETMWCWSFSRHVIGHRPARAVPCGLCDGVFVHTFNSVNFS